MTAVVFAATTTTIVSTTTTTIVSASSGNSNSDLVHATIALVIVTAVMAVATAGMAIVTGVMAHRTREAATATARAADAAEKEAAATVQLAREARLHRELTWAPLLSIEVVTSSHAGAGSPYTEGVKVTNIGRGPAVDCLYVTRIDGDWSFLAGVDLKEGGDLQRSTSPGQNDPPWVVLAPRASDPDQTARLVRVLICSDLFGTRYRFGGIPAEVSRETDNDRPPWATWHP